MNREEIKKRIYELSLFTILTTQKIDTSFAVKYILQKKYQLTPLEETITVETVLQYQPHLKKEELIRGLLEYESDDDSCDDFDQV